MNNNNVINNNNICPRFTRKKKRRHTFLSLSTLMLVSSTNVADSFTISSNHIDNTLIDVVTLKPHDTPDQSHDMLSYDTNNIDLPICSKMQNTQLPSVDDVRLDFIDVYPISPFSVSISMVNP